MQEIIQEPVKVVKWNDGIKEKVKSVVSLLGVGGRIGISWQVGNKEFFLGGSMQTIEVERVIKIKNSNFKLHQGESRVVDL
jgi:hypothetical protein